jgi:formylglycine-generating enzyme required for sulfatase activity
MDGNVEEWVQDWYQETYTSGTAVDPAGPSSGSFRVIRGGGLHHGALGCRLALRWTAHPGADDGSLGFRLLRVAQ